MKLFFRWRVSCAKDVRRYVDKLVKGSWYATKDRIILELYIYMGENSITAKEGHLERKETFRVAGVPRVPPLLDTRDGRTPQKLTIESRYTVVTRKPM